MLTAKRDATAALRFFHKAIRHHGEPEIVAIDKSVVNTAALGFKSFHRAQTIQVGIEWVQRIRTWWKWNTAYNRGAVAETAMYRVKQLFGGDLTLRDYDTQIGEPMAMIRTLNKMTRAGMPESVRII